MDFIVLTCPLFDFQLFPLSSVNKLILFVPGLLQTPRSRFEKTWISVGNSNSVGYPGMNFFGLKFKTGSKQG